MRGAAKYGLECVASDDPLSRCVWWSSSNVRLVGKDDDARQNVARSTNWKTLQPWQAEKNGIEVYTRIYSLSIPALTSVTFMLWNWVLPYLEARSLAS
jgi:hypothetical protein